MKAFKRDNPYLSLCGLNCRLCTMNLSGYCPGCGQGKGNQPCAIARCGMEHEVSYCFLCKAYPCMKYDEWDRYDSFITHRHCFKDFQRAQAMGIVEYNKMQVEKRSILDYVLERYNDGRKKTFYTISINLLELEDIHVIMNQIKGYKDLNSLTKKEQAQYVSTLFLQMSEQRHITLTLRKKPKDKTR